MDVEALTAVFKALGNESRLKILNAIKNSQMQCACSPDSPSFKHLDDGTLCCVDEIVAKFDMAQSTISQHLKELHRAGLLERHKRAQWVYYTINRGTIEALSQYLDQFAVDLVSPKDTGQVEAS